MAYGRRNLGRAGQVLLGLAMTLLALISPPAFAQSARVPVEGVPAGLSDDLRRLLREEPEPQTLFEAQRQAERAAGIVSQFLESEGYYEAEVEPIAEGVETFTRSVRVTHGPLYIYSSARIEYLSAPPDATTQTELESMLVPLDPGIPARAQPVIETGDGLLARLRRAGYPDARAEPVDALADGRMNSVELTFRLSAGLRASFGDVKFTGLERTREDYLQRLKPWERGERYSPEKLDELRGRLAETGLFETAAVRLDDSAQTTPGDTVSREVEVEVKERERRTIALGASASTSEGFGVEGEWELRNISGRGDSINFAAQLATLERRLETTYRRPNIQKYGRNLRLGAKIEDFETDAFDQSGYSVSATIEEQLTPRVRGSLGLEAGFASILDAQAIAAGTGRRDVYILDAPATAEYLGVRDILDPKNGLRARIDIEPGVTFGDTNIAYTRIVGEASIYSDFGTENLVGALRGRVGTIAGPSGAPPDRLFFAGGGGSVRGFEYQSLSPEDPNGVPIGGRSLIELSAEARYRATNSLGYVVFVDAGAAGSNVEPAIDAMGVGAGFGVRYYAGFGPLRADIGFPLNKQQGDADFQIYISIGQAF
jgi:translocation and assembly module TamA